MAPRMVRASTVVITGATSGIGRETAKEFARARARVVVAGRREERLRELAGEIEAKGGEVLAVRTDVSDRSQVERLIEHAVTRLAATTATGTSSETPAAVTGQSGRQATRVRTAVT